MRLPFSRNRATQPPHHTPPTVEDPAPPSAQPAGNGQAETYLATQGIPLAVPVPDHIVLADRSRQLTFSWVSGAGYEPGEVDDYKTLVEQSMDFLVAQLTQRQQYVLQLAQQIVDLKTDQENSTIMDDLNHDYEQGAALSKIHVLNTELQRKNDQLAWMSQELEAGRAAQAQVEQQVLEISQLRAMIETQQETIQEQEQNIVELLNTRAAEFGVNLNADLPVPQQEGPDVLSEDWFDPPSPPAPAPAQLITPHAAPFQQGEAVHSNAAVPHRPLFAPAPPQPPTP